MESYYQWHIERTIRQEGIIGHENSQFFPTWLFTKGLCKSHFIITVTASPEGLGWPLRRRRKLSVALSRSSLIWIGRSLLQGTKEEFTNLFCRRVVLDLDGDALNVTASEPVQGTSTIGRGDGVPSSARSVPLPTST